MPLYVVFGATGKLGNATVEKLCRQGEHVRAVVRDTSRTERFKHLGCEVVRADLRDPNAVIAAMHGADAVQVICPPSATAVQPLEEMSLFAEVLSKALDVTRPELTVAISDYGAQIPTGTGVTMGFHILEGRLGELGLPIVFLRSAEHMENWKRTFAFVAKAGILPSMHHPLTKGFPTVSSPDVGVLGAELLTSPPKKGIRIVHVEGPRRYSANDVARILGATVHRDVVARETPRSEWAARLTQAGSGEPYARLVAELYDTHNKGLIDVEPGVGEVRLGTTTLEEAFERLRGSWNEAAGG